MIVIKTILVMALVLGIFLPRVSLACLVVFLWWWVV
jgi:hypothetical protein